ncbi:hypothetical protein [Nakamurella deserti]|uniref:hypothetical protein n=1 Tax=Nakamurella deserti TaxID=2164074 RepID=UPI000DBE9CB7|nr:hypothetical protein [Nakamurella deserti]
MQNLIVGWLGIVIFVVAVLATVGADFFRQRDSGPRTTTAETIAARTPGGRVFWLTVVSVLLAVVAVIATVIRLATLA